MVRRHDGLGAAGPDPVLREAEQGGERVHGAVQLQPPVQRGRAALAAHIAHSSPASELRLKCQFCLLDSEDIISTYFTF